MLVSISSIGLPFSFHMNISLYQTSRFCISPHIFVITTLYSHISLAMLCLQYRYWYFFLFSPHKFEIFHNELLDSCIACIWNTLRGTVPYGYLSLHFFVARYHSLVRQTLMLVDARSFVHVNIFFDVSLLEVGYVTCTKLWWLLRIQSAGIVMTLPDVIR